MPTGDDPIKVETLTLNPAWRVLNTPGLEGPILGVRHPDHGWLYFWLPRDEATSLAAFVVDVVGAKH